MAFLLFIATLSTLGFSPSIYVVTFTMWVLLFVAFDFRNLAHLMWLIGLTAFVVHPLLAIHDLVEHISFDLVLFFFLSSILFLLTSEIRQPLQQPKSNLTYPVFTFGLACLGVLLLFALELVPLGRHAFVPLLVLLMYHLIWTISLKKAVIIQLFFFSVLAVHLLFFWGGFGRLPIVSWIAASAWMLWVRFSLPFGKIVLVAPVFFSEIVPGVLRRGLSMREQYLVGNTESNLEPFIRANSFANTFRENDFPALIDQFFVSFFNWVPRRIWPEKPDGFGFVFTLRELSDGHIAAGHSTATTFAGEHLYFIGAAGFASMLITVMMVAFIYRFMAKNFPSRPYIFLLLALHIPTFVWGGLASYASRFWVGATGLFFAYLFFVLVSRIVFKQHARSNS